MSRSVIFIVADYKQGQGGGATRGWAIFGVVSCMYRNFLLYFVCVLVIKN